MKYVATVVLAVVVFSTAADLAAQRNNPDDIVVLTSARDVEGLRSIKRIVVFLDGELEHETRVLRDALSIALRGIGWDVIDAVEIDAASSKDFQSWWNGLDPLVRQDPEKLEQYLRANWTSDTRLVLNSEVALTQLVSADAYFNGTVLFGQHRYQGRLDKTDLVAESQQAVVVNLSFQVVRRRDVEARPVFEAVLGYRLGGKDILNVVESVRSLLQERLKTTK